MEEIQRHIFLGNTRLLLIDKYIELISSRNIPPDNILFLSFDTKPILEKIIPALKEKTIPGFEEHWVLDYSAFARKLLRKHFLHIDLNPDFKVITGLEERLILEYVLKKVQLNIFDNVKNFQGFKKEFVNIIDAIKINRIDFFNTEMKDDVLKTKKEDLIKIFNAYGKEFGNKLLDYRDLIIKTIELFNHDQEIQNFYANKFKYILVDNLEDISVFEYELLLKLCFNKTNNLLFKGDKSKSVQSFRGARPDIYMDKLCKKLELEEEILSDNNKSIKKQAISFDTDTQEIRFVLREIRDLVRLNKCDFKDCVILRRDFANVGDKFREICKELNIPYKINYGINFSSFPFIINLIDKLRDLSREKNNKDKTLIEVVDDILKSEKFWYLFYEDEEAREVLKEFYKMVEDYSSIKKELGSFNNKPISLKEFIYDLDSIISSYNMDIKLKSKNKNVVNIMTIHNVKGKSFKNVFLTGMAEAIFPREYQENLLFNSEEIEKLKLSNILSSDKFIDEEKRVFNVATSCSEENLCLTYSKNYIQAKDLTSSSFIKQYPIIENKVNYINCFDNGLEHIQTKVELSCFMLKNNIETEELKTYRENSIPSNVDMSAIWDDFNYSQSKINTYKKCPRKFMYRYLLGVTEKINPYSVMGIFIHRVLEIFHKDKKSSMNFYITKAKEQIDKVLNEIWQNNKFSNESEGVWFKKEALEILTKYIDYLKDLEYWNIESLETDFNTKIDNYNFRGRIDRVDKKINGEFELIDYKTASSTKLEKALITSLKKNDDFQLLIYYFACLEKFKERLTKLSILWLKKGKKATLDLNDESIKSLMVEAKKDLIKTIKEIEECKFDVLEKGSSECRLCDYIRLCENR